MVGSILNKILRIDLSKGEINVEPLNMKWAEDYIGGRGLGTKMYFEEVGPNVDPLSPENNIYILNGPLTGTMTPSTGRYMVITRAPLTGTIGCSNSGGHFGPELKYAGYDGIVVEGKSDKPVYLWIENDKVEIRPAGHIWGKEVPQTTELLKKETHKEGKVLCIGPAGEKLSLISAIMNDTHRAAGRSGVGAVMGVKNLKGIVVRGTNVLEAVDIDKFMETHKEAYKAILAHPFTGGEFPRLGTQHWVNKINGLGAYPVNNFQDSGFAEEAKEISGEAMVEKGHLIRNKSCFNCPVRCGRVTRTFKPEKVAEGPEYEPAWGFGADCGIYDLDPIIAACARCNEIGVDSISMPTTIACAMELYEKGYLPKEDAGCDLRFGNKDIIVDLVTKTGYREGIGNLLADGSYRLAEKYGHPELSISVKMQELPAYEPRTLQGMGLGFATSNRGACHMKGFLGAYEAFDSKPESIEDKPPVLKGTQDAFAAMDSLGMCLIGGFGMSQEQVVTFLSTATGIDYTLEKYLKCGERIWNIEKLFNVACGFTKDDDNLPPRLLEEPQKYGPYKGKVNHLYEMLPTYYRLRGWDENGIPTREKMIELGLEDAYDRIMSSFKEVAASSDEE